MTWLVTIQWTPFRFRQLFTWTVQRKISQRYQLPMILFPQTKGTALKPKVSDGYRVSCRILCCWRDNSRLQPSGFTVCSCRLRKARPNAPGPRRWWEMGDRKVRGDGLRADLHKPHTLLCSGRTMRHSAKTQISCSLSLCLHRLRGCLQGCREPGQSCFPASKHSINVYVMNTWIGETHPIGLTYEEREQEM